MVGSFGLVHDATAIEDGSSALDGGIRIASVIFSALFDVRFSLAFALKSLCACACLW